MVWGLATLRCASGLLFKFKFGSAKHNVGVRLHVDDAVLHLKTVRGFVSERVLVRIDKVARIQLLVKEAAAIFLTLKLFKIKVQRIIDNLLLLHHDWSHVLKRRILIYPHSSMLVLTQHAIVAARNLITKTRLLHLPRIGSQLTLRKNLKYFISASLR